jgi:hypothetical protein
MPRKQLHPVPSILPRGLTEEECFALVRDNSPWTGSQARVVVAGILHETNEDVAAHLKCSEHTVKVHYAAACDRVAGGRKFVTALAVAIIWIHGEQQST